MTASPSPRRTAPLAVAVAACALLAWSGAAQAWSLTIQTATRRVYLHVGDGVANGNNNTINRVEVSVPATVLGNGSALTMLSNSGQSRSLSGDNYQTCPDPSRQVLIGASYRANNNNAPASATLSVTSPGSLTSGAGDTIPISQISWSVSAPGSSVPNVIPAGTFNGGTQLLATVPANRYIENCHSFLYANSVLPAAGTYNGRVTYTMSSP